MTALKFLWSWLIALRYAGKNQHKATLVDSLNGNIGRMVRAFKTLDYLRLHWDALPDQARFEAVQEVVGVLSNLLTVVSMWRDLADNQRLVEEMDKKAKEAQKAVQEEG